MKKIAFLLAFVAFVGSTTISLAATESVKIEKQDDEKKKKCKKKKACCKSKKSCAKEGEGKSCHGKTESSSTEK